VHQRCTVPNRVRSKKNELNYSTFFRIKAKANRTSSKLFRIEEKQTDVVLILLVLNKNEENYCNAFRIEVK